MRVPRSRNPGTPETPQVWGVSSGGGYVWVIDTRQQSNQRRVLAVGGLPYSIEFSSKGDRAYTTASGADQLIAIDCATRAIVARPKPARNLFRCASLPTTKFLLVVNSAQGRSAFKMPATLQQRAEIPVIPNPDEVLAVPDGSIAFVMSRSENRLSVVDVRRGVLLTNLVLAVSPRECAEARRCEVYVISPGNARPATVNTWTHEMGDYMMLGSAPADGLIVSDASEMYVADRAPGRDDAPRRRHRR